MELKDIQLFIRQASTFNHKKSSTEANVAYISSILPLLESVPACITAVLLALTNALKPIITDQIRLQKTNVRVRAANLLANAKAPSPSTIEEVATTTKYLVELIKQHGAQWATVLLPVC